MASSAKRRGYARHPWHLILPDALTAEESISDVARRMNCNFTTVFRQCRKLRINLPPGSFGSRAPRGRNWDVILKEALAAGQNAADVARRQNCSPSNVHARCRQRGIELPLHTHGEWGTWDAILAEAVSAGESVTEVATRIGCSTANVHARCRARGIALPNARQRVRDEWARILAEAQAAGESPEDVACRTGRSERAVRRHCRRLDIELPLTSGGASEVHGRVSLPVEEGA